MTKDEKPWSQADVLAISGALAPVLESYALMGLRPSLHEQTTILAEAALKAALDQGYVKLSNDEREYVEYSLNAQVQRLKLVSELKQASAKLGAQAAREGAHVLENLASRLRLIVKDEASAS